MEALFILIIVAVALFFGIRWAIKFVAGVTNKTGYGFLSMPFWLLLASLFLAIYVGFTATEEYLVAIVVFGAIAIAGAININRLGFQDGAIFTLLQCIAIYCSIIVYILYLIFQGAKDTIPD